MKIVPIRAVFPRPAPPVEQHLLALLICLSIFSFCLLRSARFFRFRFLHFHGFIRFFRFYEHFHRQRTEISDHRSDNEVERSYNWIKLITEWVRVYLRNIIIFLFQDKILGEAKMPRFEIALETFLVNKYKLFGGLKIYENILFG